jgi:hypothetical protein
MAPVYAVSLPKTVISNHTMVGIFPPWGQPSLRKGLYPSIKLSHPHPELFVSMRRMSLCKNEVMPCDAWVLEEEAEFSLEYTNHCWELYLKYYADLAEPVFVSADRQEWSIFNQELSC